MEAHTQTHLKQLRELLEYRLAELRADVAAVAGMQIADDIRDAHDQENIAGAHQAAVRDAAQELHDREELESVAAAIGRLDGGVYGDCIECGEPIAEARLNAIPWTRSCNACKEKQG